MSPIYHPIWGLMLRTLSQAPSAPDRQEVFDYPDWVLTVHVNCGTKSITLNWKKNSLPTLESSIVTGTS